ncbi:PD-(D/E)XK nuclease family protein [Pseudohaliea sp.]|uniref:PD-(D/E)XK nuclease family protein n=1 Tax=Pseudohaliea sp. TaxID=2740289 RepID=UPI0032EBF1DD
MAAKPLFDVAPLAPWLERGDTVLTANHRLARYIQRAWDERQRAAGARAWAAAPASAVESWLLARWEDAVAAGRLPLRRCLEPAAVHYLWRQVIAADDDGATGFTLLQPGEAARLAQRARDTLLRWRIDGGDEATRQLFRLGGDSAHFLRWLDRFEEELARLGAATPADCLRDLLEDPAPAAGPLTLVACHDLSPLVDACLARLGEPLEEAPPAAPRAMPEVRCYAGQHDELRAIADWCAALAAARPGARIGVVVDADSVRRAALDYQLRRAFDCVDANYHRLPVNYSAGLTLDRAPLVRDALGLLALLEGSVDLSAFLALLRSRFLPLPDRDDAAMVTFVERLRALGARRIELGLLRYQAGRAGTALGQRLLELREQTERPGRRDGPGWVGRFREFLAAFGWPGTGLDSLEYQQYGLWEETLGSFERCAALGPPLGAAEALQLLRECLGQRVFQPKTADTDIQVLGALEAAGLAFDALWVSGMHAGAWPAPARPNPLIPLSLQRRTGMPQCSPEGEHAFASRLLARYAAAVDSLVMSTALAADGAPLLPSPYLGDAPAPETAPAPGEQAWRRRREALELETVADSCAPAVGGEGVRGGAGLLESQAACPFRAFARYRLRLAAPEEPVTGLNALERGVLLHGALYSLWGSLGDSGTLAALDGPARRRHCEASAEAAMDALRPERRQVVGGACLALEQARLADTLVAWLDLEAARPQSFAVIAREEPVELALAGLVLNLKLDRVDRLEDGGELVIDYKSGSTQLAGIFRERIDSPQLPLYSLARGPALNGVAYAQLRPRDLRLLAAGVGEGLADLEKNLGKYLAGDPAVEDWEGLRSAWRERLEALAGELMAGEAPVAPTATACRHCDLASLCRIGAVEDSAGEGVEFGAADSALPGAVE